MILKLKTGDVTIELYEDVAPKHVERIKKLADEGSYDNVVFHRVIDGFMAQTGDVKFGNSSSKDYDIRRAGMGGSDLPDLVAEFNNLPHEKGTLSMARSSAPNSANSQFFICFEAAPFLIISINPIPFITFPKAEYCLSKCGAESKQIKN